MLAAIFVGLLLILFMLGVSIPYALAITGIVGMYATGGFGVLQMQTMVQKMVNGVNGFSLMAIPFFLIAGKLMNVGSITRRIFDFCNGLVGWIPGGLGHANILASVVFAGMSGSAVADAAGLGTIEIKAMEEQGFDTDFSAAVTAASSTIGPIIPPSIPLIMYGVSASVSISSLLMGGVLPGVLCAITLSIMIVIISIRRKYPRRHFPSAKELGHLFSRAFLSLLTPVILIGGIMGGIFTATEAASVASLYAIILTMVIYREAKMKDLYTVIKEAAQESAGIMLVVASSYFYGFVITKLQVPTLILNAFLAVSSNKAIFLILINLFFLFVGCFMECNSAILILTPIVLPAAISFGIDPIHFGLIMVFNLMIGLLTPPVGMCLYATMKVAKISFDRMVKSVLIFFVPLVITLILITYIPQITLFLPGILG